MIVVLLACTGPGDSDPCAAAPTWDGWVNGFFVSYCDSCHSATTADRHNAPPTITFDTEEQASALAGRIQVRVVDETTMPPAGGVFPEDLDKLESWLGCQ